MMESIDLSLQCPVCPELGFPRETEETPCGLCGEKVTFRDRVVVLRTDTSSCVHQLCYKIIEDSIEPLKDKVKRLFHKPKDDQQIHTSTDHAYMVAFRAIREGLPERQPITTFAQENPSKFNELVKGQAIEALEAFWKAF